MFNDDKKTEIIGETWVNLREVIVPGGGQNDLWHNLNCKGKYAGEIRIEITYYDTRPKQEKPEKVKQASANAMEAGHRDSLRGPRQPKPSIKRRPLPSDPVTGAPPPEPVEQTPQRSYQQPNSIPEQSPQRSYQQSTAIPEHVQTPPRGYQPPGYGPNQSPLQSIEYSTPPQRIPQPQGYGSNQNMSGYGTSPGMLGVSPTAQELPDDGFEVYGHPPRDDYTQAHGMIGYGGEEESVDPRYRYDTSQPPYEVPEPEEFIAPPSPEGPPPPPPAHRSRNAIQHVSSTPAMTSHASYDFPSDPRPQNQYETPPRDMHRQSMPTYSRPDLYQAYSPSANDQFRQAADGYGYDQPQPRHHSSYNSNYGSMQPTVEDAPPTPAPGSYSGHRDIGSRAPQYDLVRYDPAASPTPLNLSRRGSAAPGSNGVAAGQSAQYSGNSNGYGSNSSFRDPISSVSPQASYNPLPQQNQMQRRQSEDRIGRSSDAYSLPQIPPTLVPGMDPAIAQEISDRIYAEKRASQALVSSPRGRYDSPQYQQSRPHPLSYHEATAPPAAPAPAYDDHQSRYGAGSTAPLVKPRAISPDPRTPARKSVSPSPGPAPNERRLSGVPFGPDSYNALNPALADSAPSPSLSGRYDSKQVDQDEKIITYDCREIDPSDHIPESNYAPLHETKGPKYASQLPDRNYRPPPSSTTGRKQLRLAGRPHSMSASSPIYMNNNPPDPTTPTARNRLQKKSNRMSAQPASYSSPLAPITPYQDNTYAPGSLPRQNPGEYSNENYAPQSYGSSPGYRGSPGGPPPPAKVPIGSYTQPPQANGGDPWALLEEIKNIDLGTGRARRRG